MADAGCVAPVPLQRAQESKAAVAEALERTVEVKPGRRNRRSPAASLYDGNRGPVKAGGPPPRQISLTDSAQVPRGKGERTLEGSETEPKTVCPQTVGGEQPKPAGES